MMAVLQSHQKTEGLLCVNSSVWSQSRRKEQCWEWLGELELLSGLLQSGPLGAGVMTERPSNTLSVIFWIHSRGGTNRNGGHSVWPKPAFYCAHAEKLPLKLPLKSFIDRSWTYNDREFITSTTEVRRTSSGLLVTPNTVVPTGLGSHLILKWTMWPKAQSGHSITTIRA